MISRFRSSALALAALPLALGLAACDKGADAGTATGGEPIAKIAPPAGKAWADMIAKTPEGGYRMGNPDAPIKLVEYGSLTCSHCAEFAEKSAVPLRDTFVASGRVSFEFRNFVRDPLDLMTAQIIRCGAPESFFALTDQAMANQPALFQKVQAAGDAAFKAAAEQPADKRGLAIAQLAGLTEFFASRGIAQDQVKTCLANAAEAEAIAKRTQEDGEKFAITGTPTFLLNGAKIEGNTWEEIKAKLEAAGAR
ncbi:MAG TPA: thioredoxin domain-containing protein [Novosphingobium sp.]